NHHVYSVLADSKDLTIKGFIPTVHDFIKGGSMFFPKGFDQVVQKNNHIDGYEAMGAIQFSDQVLMPGESVVLYLSIGIHNSKDEALHSHINLNQESFHRSL